MKWDTSSLPDNATINTATLRVWVATTAITDARQVTGDWFTWVGNNATTDYSETPQTNAHAGTNISTFTQGASADLALTNADANISRTGITYLRLHCSGGQPTGTNWFEVASWDDTVNPEPQLIVDYSVPPGQVARRNIRYVYI